MNEDITKGFTQEEDASQNTTPDFNGSCLPTSNEVEMARIAAKAQACRLDQTKVYGPPQFLLYQGDTGFMSRGDMQAIKAKQKNGKSMLMAYFMGTILRGEYGCLKCPHENLKVLYVDTEQHENNTSLQALRVHRIAGWPDYYNNERFVVLTLRGEDHKECRQLVEYTIKEMQPDAVFIDGIRDLCSNFNDMEESADLIKWEMNLSKHYNIALCSVLHVNPNSDKMRGHLGTEEQNKCSDVFTVVKLFDGDAPNYVNGRRKKKDLPPGYKPDISFNVIQTDARNRDIDEFEFVCIGEYGTPVCKTPNTTEYSDTASLTYTTQRRSNSSLNITIRFSQHQLREVLVQLRSSLIAQAMSMTEAISYLKSAMPLLELTEDAAAAWIGYCTNESYLIESRGARNSRLLRWNPSAVIPLDENLDTTPQTDCLY